MFLLCVVFVDKIAIAYITLKPSNSGNGLAIISNLSRYTNIFPPIEKFDHAAKTSS